MIPSTNIEPLAITGDLREQTIRRILNATRRDSAVDSERAIQDIVNALPLREDAAPSTHDAPELVSPFIALGRSLDNVRVDYDVRVQNQCVEARLSRGAGVTTYQLLLEAMPEHIAQEFDETFPFKQGLLAEISVDRLETIERIAFAMLEAVRQARVCSIAKQDTPHGDGDD